MSSEVAVPTEHATAPTPPVAPSGPVKRSGAQVDRVTIGRAAVPFVILGVWVLAGARSDLVPGVSESLAALWSGIVDGSLRPDLSATLSAVGAGFFLAALVGFPLGIVLARIRFLGEVFEPLIAGVFAVPRIIFYPVLLGMFGVSITAIAGSAAISAFFPIVITTIAAVRGVSETLIKLGHSLRMTRGQLIRKLLLPAAAPTLMIGFRVGFSVSFISVIIAEFFAARAGLGLVVSRSYALMQLPRMFGVIVLILAIALVGNMALWLIERRIRPS